MFLYILSLVLNPLSRPARSRGYAVSSLPCSLIILVNCYIGPVRAYQSLLLFIIYCKETTW